VGKISCGYQSVFQSTQYITDLKDMDQRPNKMKYWHAINLFHVPEKQSVV
jgi:hypothetical protein